MVVNHYIELTLARVFSPTICSSKLNLFENYCLYKLQFFFFFFLVFAQKLSLCIWNMVYEYFLFNWNSSCLLFYSRSQNHFRKQHSICLRCFVGFICQVNKQNKFFFGKAWEFTANKEKSVEFVRTFPQIFRGDVCQNAQFV